MYVLSLLRFRSLVNLLNIASRRDVWKMHFIAYFSDWYSHTRTHTHTHIDTL